MFLEPFLRLHSVTWCIILLKDAIPAREDSCHKGVYLVQHNVKASVTCQNLFSRNDGSKCSPRKYYSSKHTPSTSLGASR